MKYIIRNSGVIVLLLIILVIYSCKMDNPGLPDITTSAVTEISYSTATTGGIVTNDGGAPVVSRGVCWNTSAEPVIADSSTIDGSGGYSTNFIHLRAGF
jgi:hypothetical protein